MSSLNNTIYKLTLEQVLKEDVRNLEDDKLQILINKICKSTSDSNGANLSLEDIGKIGRYIFYRIRGLGVLEYLLNDQSINEIMVNDRDHIFVERDGVLELSKFKFESEKELYRIIQKIVGKSGREVNLSNPIVDARLEDGSRVNVILPPIAKDQPVITIRKFPDLSIDMDFLVDKNTLTQEARGFIEALVKSKYNILISGGTSSGKTTFLNAMTEFIDDSERIVTIEDSRELQIKGKENLISLETRNANSSNKGLIEIKDLIKNSLRMRPDRIIVGEVRSKEAIDMLTAQNTGHEGGISTAHANTPADMISRLEVMILTGGANFPIEAARKMIGSAIDIIIQLKRISGKKRRVTHISEVYEHDGLPIINDLFLYDYEKDSLVCTENIMKKDEKFNRT